MYSGFKISVVILLSRSYAALMPKGTNCIYNLKNNRKLEIEPLRIKERTCEFIS
jgi:hypothetical protein